MKKVTWTKGLDPESGKPIEYDPNKAVQTYIASVTPSRTNMETDICPGNMGGKNWPPTAYNPDLKLWYIPVIESCNRIKVEVMTPDKLKPREFWTGGGPSQPFRITGSVTAIDVLTGKIAGKLETPFPNLGGMLATPDLVFTGQPSGEVHALDAKSLQKLWEFNTGGGVNAPPMTFSVDGKQYIAILVGLGGAWDKWFIDFDARTEEDSAGIDALRVRTLTRKTEGPPSRGPSRFFDKRCNDDLQPFPGGGSNAARERRRPEFFKPLPTVSRRRAADPTNAGKAVFSKANCMGCHKWHGNGGGGYGGDALSLRKTELTREQIIETVGCGRPGRACRSSSAAPMTR